MPWFSSSSPFDLDVERATDMNNTSENWALMMDLCDKISNNPSSCKECLRSITKRLHSEIPHVQKQALILLDACISNCGKAFLLEVASRDFEPEIKRLITKGHPGIANIAKTLLKKWAEGEFKSDPHLNLIPSLYKKLRSNGIDFSIVEESKKSANPAKQPAAAAASASRKEADDLAKAIELSIQESKKHSSGAGVTGTSTVDSGPSHAASLYPSAKMGSSSAPAKEPRMVRALYDFEAAEDNELTFYTGEIIHVLDESDANWWKGSNQRGEGLFPANFVTSDLTSGTEQKETTSRKVQFRDSVEIRTVEVEEDEEDDEEPLKKVEIDEDKMRMALKLLHEGDPTGAVPDPLELASLEGQCLAMGPLIDAELEKIDKKHAILSRLSTDLVEALNLYHTLMRSSYSTEGMVVGVHGQPYMHPGVAPSPGPVPGHGYPAGQVPQQPVYNPYAPSYHAIPSSSAPDQNAQMHYMSQVPGMPPTHQHQAPMPVQTSQPYVPPVGYPTPVPGQYPPQAPYYAPPQAVPPSAYYPGYPPPGAYDPSKMVAVDPSQNQVYAQPMPGYDPNMMQHPGVDGMTNNFVGMNVGDGHQGHHGNSITNHQPQQPPLL